MGNEISIIIDKTLTKLVGSKYGYSIYDSQVRNKINLHQKFKIIFPTQIDNISSSFIQGFFSDIVDMIGIKQLKNNMQIETSIIKLEDFIINNLI